MTNPNVIHHHVRDLVDEFVCQIGFAFCRVFLDNLTQTFGLVPANQDDSSSNKPKTEAEVNTTKAETPKRKPMTITPERRHALQLHGQYLGALRGLSVKNRARVKNVAKESGAKAAIKLAKELKTDIKPKKQSKFPKTTKTPKTPKK